MQDYALEHLNYDHKEKASNGWLDCKICVHLHLLWGWEEDVPHSSQLLKETWLGATSAKLSGSYKRTSWMAGPIPGAFIRASRNCRWLQARSKTGYYWGCSARRRLTWLFEEGPVHQDTFASGSAALIRAEKIDAALQNGRTVRVTLL